MPMHIIKRLQLDEMELAGKKAATKIQNDHLGVSLFRTSHNEGMGVLPAIYVYCVQSMAGL